MSQRRDSSHTTVAAEPDAHSVHRCQSAAIPSIAAIRSRTAADHATQRNTLSFNELQ